MFEIGQLTRLPLGYVGESGTRTISIDMKAWLDECPGALIMIQVIRPVDHYKYPAAYTKTGGVIHWTVDGSEVMYAGNGLAQIALYNPDTKQEYKSRVVGTIVAESLDGFNDIMVDNTDPASKWVNQVLEAANVASSAQEKAEEVMNSIPQDYKTLSGNVSALSGEIAAESERAKNEEARIESLFTTPVNEAVAEWLEDNPQATTTVQDGSLTEEKIHPDFLPKIKNRFVTPQMFGAVGKGKTDDTKGFQDAIDYVFANGGGRVYIPAGEYKIRKTLYVKRNVILEGVSQGSSIIQLEDGYDCDVVHFENNYNCGCHDLSIKGNRYYTAPSAEDKYGVVIGADIENPDGMINNSQMDNFTFYNVEVTNVSGTGIYCKPYSWVYYLHNVTIRNCTCYGIIINGSDNMFSNFYVDNCGMSGVRLISCNNKLSNFKIIFCGAKMSANRKERCGLYMELGNRCQLNNIECQENRGDGFYFNNCANSVLTNLVSDANGFAHKNDSSMEPGHGFVFTNCSDLTGICHATSYTASQDTGFLIDGTNTRINIYGEVTANHVTKIVNQGSECTINTAHDVAEETVSKSFSISNSTANIKVTREGRVCVLNLSRLELTGLTGQFENIEIGELPSDMWPIDNISTPLIASGYVNAGCLLTIMSTGKLIINNTTNTDISCKPSSATWHSRKIV